MGFGENYKSNVKRNLESPIEVGIKENFNHIHKVPGMMYDFFTKNKSPEKTTTTVTKTNTNTRVVTRQQKAKMSNNQEFQSFLQQPTKFNMNQNESSIRK